MEIGMKRHEMTARLSLDVYDALKSASEAEGRSISKQLEWALACWLRDNGYLGGSDARKHKR
jgi:hypothetical protein